MKDAAQPLAYRVSIGLGVVGFVGAVPCFAAYYIAKPRAMSHFRRILENNPGPQVSGVMSMVDGAFNLLAACALLSVLLSTALLYIGYMTRKSERAKERSFQEQA